MHGSARSLPGRSLAAALAAFLATGGCIPGPLLEPEPGAPAYRQLGLVDVPGGFVNAAGGNLIVERLDMSIDTIMGTWEVGATLDSAGDGWLWNFQITYDGTTFLDPTGAQHDVTGLLDGETIPGTRWVKADLDTIETKGGLAFHFDPQGRLDYVALRTGDYPRVEYTWGPASLEMATCTQAAACLPFYTVALDAAGRPLSITDARTGRVADFTYDPLGRLTVARSPLEVEEGWPGTRYEYADWSWRLTAITTSEGERTEYDWQAGTRIWLVRSVGESPPHPLHGFRFRARDGEGLYSTVHINPLGGETVLYFDEQRRLHRLERTDAGETVQYAWSGKRLTEMTLPGGVTTAFSYTGEDVTTMTEPSGNVVEITYAPGAVNLEDPFARPVARIEDSLGLVEERTYDAQGRVETVTNGEGEAVTFDRGVITLESITNAAGLSWQYPSYGIHGHWLEVQGAIEDKRAFDAVGNVTAPSFGRQEGGLLTQGYDGNRNLTTLDVAATEAGTVISQDQVSVTYRSDGQMDYVARPQGADHDFIYDAIGRLSERREKVDGVWQATLFEYDAAGNRTARERPNGMREEWEYDVYGRVVRHRALRDGVLEGEAVTTWQDGRVASYFDSLRDTTEVYTHDAAGRLQTVLFGYGETLTLEHDLRSRRTAEIYALPGEGQIRRLDFEYDLANRRIRTVADQSELLVERVYADGRLSLLRYGNGLEREHSYDSESDELVATVTTDAASGIVEQTSIVREVRQDPARFVIELYTATSLKTTREEYWLGIGGSLANPSRQVGKRVWHWTGNGGSHREFVYDELSNQIDNGAGDVLVYNSEANRLLEASFAATGETVTYTYDTAGYADSRNGLPIDWTATGRLASHDDVAIEWDLRGRPIAITSDGMTREFVFFGGAVDNDPDTGALGALDLEDVVVPFGSSERLYRHLDFRNNVSFVTDETGQVVTHYQYSPYGVEAVYGVQVDNQTFVGRQEIGDLMILGARIYDPAVGRFLSPDPVFQLLNQYSYTFGNPVSYWDPNGTVGVIIAAALAVGASLIAGGIGAIIAAKTIGAALTGLALFAVGVAFILAALYLGETAGQSTAAVPGGSGDSGRIASNNGGRIGGSIGGGSIGVSGGDFAGCSPVVLTRLPSFGWLLAILLPLQLILAGLALRRRRSMGAQRLESSPVLPPRDDGSSSRL